jgi:hypothetical protein
MPGFLLHVGAQVQCAHGGSAQPATPNPRVLVGGQPTALLSTLYLVGGCTFPPPPGGNGPCVTGQWLVGTIRITSGGQPLCIMGGQSVCTPTGTPLVPIASQTRVLAS